MEDTTQWNIVQFTMMCESTTKLKLPECRLLLRKLFTIIMC
jgi:hypothetical protein